MALREPRRKIYSDFLTACRETDAAVWDLMAVGALAPYPRDQRKRTPRCEKL